MADLLTTSLMVTSAPFALAARLARATHIRRRQRCYFPFDLHQDAELCISLDFRF